MHLFYALLRRYQPIHRAKSETITSVSRNAEPTPEQNNIIHTVITPPSNIIKPTCRNGHNHGQLKPRTSELAIAAIEIKVKLVRPLRMTSP